MEEIGNQVVLKRIRKADAEMMGTICSLSQEVVDLNFKKKHIRETFSASKDSE